MALSEKNFPHGLAQAPDVHFSMDALLLAAFPQGQGLRVLDVGTGCGVVGLGLLLRGVAASVEGLELEPAQVACASENARHLALERQFDVRQVDVRHMDAVQGPPCDLVVCNPPWRCIGEERLPASLARQTALYGDTRTLGIFVRAGASRLRRGGRYAMVIGAARLADGLRAMGDASLSVERVRLIYPRIGSEAVCVLMEGRLAVRTRLHVLPPLILHDRETNQYAAEAIAFCPWLSTGS